MNAPAERPVPSGVRVWLQLLRAPNLFTVPGDPISGYLVSNAGFWDFSLACVALASLCFYAAGLLLNDWVDLAEDTRERPTRPLPAGLASPKTVWRWVWILNALGIGILAATRQPPAVLGGLFTVASVWSYNRVTKGKPVLGALNMGLCRAGSVMIGACAGPAAYAKPIAGIFAAVSALFVAAVTHLARHETHPTYPLHARFLPALTLGLGAFMGISHALQAPDKAPSAFLFALPVLGALLLLVRMLQKPAPKLPPLIGAHIRLLLPLQAAVCWFGASQSVGPLFAGILLVCWPLSRGVSRRFYAS
jgi:4-hydroxybenzoate polyprenyltransferase